MNLCPITYDVCQNTKYSQKWLKLLAPKLKELHDFSYTAKKQLELALQYAKKLLIQGVQSKLITKSNIANGLFEIVDSGGIFIFKPPHHIYSELPQNKDVTMRLAQAVGLDIPLHGMIYNRDGSLTYFIKRFDRLPKGHKVAVEDFSQLMGFSRETKYDSSMEKLVPTIEKHCTFPTLEKIKLFRLTLFNFLVGNEDMQLKNFSLIRREKQVCLSPAYDLLNSSIIISSRKEIALPVRSKKSRLTAQDLIDYYGKEQLGLSEKTIAQEIEQFKCTIIVACSFRKMLSFRWI